MQQRQPRLGDILDDYCPRERRVTNHAVVAMVGDEVKQTRCTTCDAEHQYKHAKVPRQRRKKETPAALYAQVAAGAPKRVVHEVAPEAESDVNATAPEPVDSAAALTASLAASGTLVSSEAANKPLAASDVEAPTPEGRGAPGNEEQREEGPVHRPLIRASLPRPEGQTPSARPIPEFTIRQPGGRSNRFRPRHQRGAQQSYGNRSNGTFGGGLPRSGAPRQGGRPPQGAASSRHAHRHGPGRKRSK